MKIFEISFRDNCGLQDRGQFISAHKVEGWTNDYAFFGNPDDEKKVTFLVPREIVAFVKDIDESDTDVISREAQDYASAVDYLQGYLEAHGYTWSYGTQDFLIYDLKNRRRSNRLPRPLTISSARELVDPELAQAAEWRKIPDADLAWWMNKSLLPCPYCDGKVNKDEDRLECESCGAWSEAPGNNHKDFWDGLCVPDT